MNVFKEFARRIEKFFTGKNTIPTVPETGTTHLDTTWKKTDIYKGELALNTYDGRLFSSDGHKIIHYTINDGFIVEGMELLKANEPGAGTPLWIRVKSGKISINNKIYEHDEEDVAEEDNGNIKLDENTSVTPRIDYIFAIINNNKVEFKVEKSSNIDDIKGQDVTITIPDESIFLGMVFIPGNYTQESSYKLSTYSVSSLFANFPTPNMQPLGFINQFINWVFYYKPYQFYYKNQMVVDINTKEGIDFYKLYIAIDTHYSNHEKAEDSELFAPITDTLFGGDYLFVGGPGIDITTIPEQININTVYDGTSITTEIPDPLNPGEFIEEDGAPLYVRAQGEPGDLQIKIDVEGETSLGFVDDENIIARYENQGAWTFGQRGSESIGNHSLIFGQNNDASAKHSMAFGKDAEAILYGEITKSSGGFNDIIGTSQKRELTLQTITVDNTIKQMALDGNYLLIELGISSGAIAFEIKVVASLSGSQDSAAFFFDGLIKNAGTNFEFVGSPSKTEFIDLELDTIDCNVDLDNEHFNINVTGLNSATIRWAAYVNMIEIKWEL